MYTDFEEEEEVLEILVIDVGSGFCEAGFAGDEAPRVIFPIVLGRPRSIFWRGFVSKDAYVGNEAIARTSERLHLTWPVQRAIVKNWDHMEKVWHHAFYNELRRPPEEHPVLLTEMLLNPRSSRERMTLIMFETFNVPALYIISQTALSCTLQKRLGWFWILVMVLLIPLLSTKGIQLRTLF